MNCTERVKVCVHISNLGNAVLKLAELFIASKHVLDLKNNLKKKKRGGGGGGEEGKKQQQKIGEKTTTKKPLVGKGNYNCSV